MEVKEVQHQKVEGEGEETQLRRRGKEETREIAAKRGPEEEGLAAPCRVFSNLASRGHKVGEIRKGATKTKGIRHSVARGDGRAGREWRYSRCGAMRGGDTRGRARTALD